MPQCSVAKKDWLDARVLAESVRLDHHLLGVLETYCSEVVLLRDCTRLDAQLKQEIIRLINQMREMVVRHCYNRVAVAVVNKTTRVAQVVLS